MTTPAIVYDLNRLNEVASLVQPVRCDLGLKILYSIKACAFFDVLQTLVDYLDGFSVSSLFEARFVRQLYSDCLIHLTTPGLRYREFAELVSICDFITFNSRTQLHRLGPIADSSTSVGLRVNTHVSRVSDRRYDPARKDSQLGIPLPELSSTLSSSPVPVKGLHFHTNSDSMCFSHLRENVEAVCGSHRFAWVNFGGGYLLEQISDFDPLRRSVETAMEKIAGKVFIEPGSGLVRSSGNLVTTVIDAFERNGRRIAVLDTTVNHIPEALEFDYRPDVLESSACGGFEYRLVGSSCLAGDVFGCYRFNDPLSVGAMLTFTGVGAYAQSKSHRFNGINLPSVWVRTSDGTLTERQAPDYSLYEKQWIPT